MSGRLQPALWGGLFIGVLSGMPIVEAGNFCCCLWVVSGGVLAVWLAQQNTPYGLTAAEGALLGLTAGLIGAVIAFPINLVFEGWKRDLMMRMLESANLDIPAEFRDALENTRTGVIGRLFSLMITLVIDGIFGLLGGLLGVAMFKKNVPPPPPPPGTIEVLPPQ